MKFLFIGLGGIGQRHLRNLRTLLGDSAEVHAYRVRRSTPTLTDRLEVESGVDLEKKYDVCVHHELDAALAVRPQAVYICNPSSFHVPVAQAAIDAGCHLFVEKPLSHNLEGVEALIESTKRQKLVGFVGYQLRFHPCLRLLHEKVQQGVIGRLLTARVVVGEYLPNWHRYEDYRKMYASRADLGGGVVLSQIHELDYLYWLFGLPRQVFAMGGHLSSLDIDVEDVASSIFEFNLDGRPFPVHLHQDYVQRPPSRGCELIGDEGKLLVNLLEATLIRFDKNGELVERHSFPDFPRNELFVAEMRHFLACLEGREQPQVSLHDGAQSLRMALAVKQSMVTNMVVAL